jgi:RNase P subunit RPR2
MPNTVTGQSFAVVICKNCETELSFQAAKQSRRHASQPGDVELTCNACGHIAAYQPAHIRQTQAQYPL